MIEDVRCWLRVQDMYGVVRRGMEGPLDVDIDIEIRQETLEVQLIAVAVRARGVIFLLLTLTDSPCTMGLVSATRRKGCEMISARGRISDLQRRPFRETRLW